MNDKVGIKKITITINDKDIDVTMSEAKELYRQLDGLFGMVTIPFKQYPVVPNFEPMYPNPVRIWC